MTLFEGVILQALPENVEHNVKLFFENLYPGDDHRFRKRRKSTYKLVENFSSHQSDRT